MFRSTRPLPQNPSSTIYLTHGAVFGASKNIGVFLKLLLLNMESASIFGVGVQDEKGCAWISPLG
jgi:hypothetical protein